MGQVIPVLMPQAGNSMEEGTVRLWHVKVGDQIAVGAILCEIETDKATVDVEATDAGRLARIVAAQGAVVPVKQPIAFLAESDADVEAFLKRAPTAPATATKAPVEASHGVPRESSPRIESTRRRASPAARRLARDRGIDLADLPDGTGPGGRILSLDLPETSTPRTSDNRTIIRATIDAAPLLRATDADAGAAMEKLLQRAVSKAAQSAGIDASITTRFIDVPGIDEVTLPIPPGNAAIAAFTAAHEAAIAQHGVMRAAMVMTVTLTADSRQIDVDASLHLMASLVKLLQTPAAILEPS